MLKLTHRLERKPNTLVGRRAAARGARPLADPAARSILLLDEPLTNLDAKLRHDMRAELKRLHRQFGMTIIYATPDELEALSMGEEIAVMRDGAVVQQGTPDELYETPADLYVATKIGSPHMNLIDATSSERRGKSLETPFGSSVWPASSARAARRASAFSASGRSDLRARQDRRSALAATGSSARAARRCDRRLGRGERADLCGSCCPSQQAIGMKLGDAAADRASIPRKFMSSSARHGVAIR